MTSTTTREPLAARTFPFGQWAEIGLWLDEQGYNQEGHRVVVTFRDEDDVDRLRQAADELGIELELPAEAPGYLVTVWRENQSLAPHEIEALREAGRNS